MEFSFNIFCQLFEDFIPLFFSNVAVENWFKWHLFVGDLSLPACEFCFLFLLFLNLLHCI